jgi:hypothetical protein
MDHRERRIRWTIAVGVLTIIALGIAVTVALALAVSDETNGRWGCARVLHRPSFLAGSLGVVRRRCLHVATSSTSRTTPIGESLTTSCPHNAWEIIAAADID